MSEQKIILSLNPTELINWCKNRKKSLNLSNQKLADLSNVPIGTIDRIMSGNYSEFKYSSIQPIIKVLIGIDEDTPLPNSNDDKQNAFYYETIEGYKLIVENKNHIIDELKKQIEYLKQENSNKQDRINKISNHIEWMEKLIDKR